MSEILDLIWYRINLKKVKYYAQIKSITLGVDIFEKLTKEAQDSQYLYSFPLQFKYNGEHKDVLFGYPVKISYRRRNLIQINLDIKRPRFKRQYYSNRKDLQIVGCGSRGYSKHSYEMMKKSLDFSQNSGIVLCDDGFRQEG